MPLLLFYDADFATSHRGHNLILATPASPYEGEAFAIARSGSLIYLCGGGKLSAPHERFSAIACIHATVAYQQLVSFFQYVSHSLPFDWKDCNAGRIISPCTFFQNVRLFLPCDWIDCHYGSICHSQVLIFHA